jgi:hypothetical protein
VNRAARRRLLRSAAGLSACLVLACCGGGGGGGGGNSTSSPAPAQPAAQQLAANQIAVTIDSGPAGTNGVNGLYASVTICAPGTSNCQTIDHVLVDTGSSGLRVIASAIAPQLIAAMPQSTNGSGRTIVECAQFADGYTWGPTQFADIKLGGETAGNAVIQVVGAAGFPSVPVACSSTGPAINTVAALGANGVLGVSIFAQDCGTTCVSLTNNGLYYACLGVTCSPAAASLAQQLWNPVALFAADNNGSSITLPAVPASGATTLSGTLTFGIGTQADNTLAATAVLTVDPAFGELNTTVGGISYPGSFVDSGSNGYFFGSGLFPACSFFIGFYCPAGAQAESGVLQGLNGATAPGNFIVGNPQQLFASNPAITVYPEIAGPNGVGGFDWGLPFFFGLTVFTAIENRATPAGNGPWVGIH